MTRFIPLLLILAACNQPAQPCLAPDGGVFVRVVHPELLVYTDAKALCESGGLRLTTADSWDDRNAMIESCQAFGDGAPCWTDGWGARSAPEGGGTGPVVVDGASLAVVPSPDLGTYLAHPVCEVPAY